MFIEVDSEEKGCKVIINLDSVLEIAPIRTGGTALFFADSAAVGGKTAMKVKDSYTMFKQFAMQTVSSDDIAKRIAKLPLIEKEQHPRFISDNEVEQTPKTESQPVAKPRGRPAKNTVMGSDAIADKN
jgi:hypothetical protein